MTLVSGNLQKMRVTLKDPVSYELRLGDECVPLNSHLGQPVHLHYTGEINCISCGRKTKKSFQQGYCFPCVRSLAECDNCIVRPETCHFDAGTCRDETWAKANCFQDHFVYLANSSGVKVGITRGSQVPTRWIDQGASQALPIFRVKNRYQSGLLEVALKAHVADRTDWRKMLKGESEPIDLPAKRDELYHLCESAIGELRSQFGEEAIAMLPDEDVVDIRYPVLEYPAKVASLNFDKTADVQGALLGIKGQYLILESGVINIRKFGGYAVQFS